MKLLRFFNIVMALLLGASVAISAPMAKAAPDPKNETYVPGEVVVAFVDGLSAQAYASQAAALAASVSAQVVRQNGNLALLSFTEDVDVQAMVDQVKGQSGVQFAEPNFVYKIPDATADATDHVGQRSYVLRRVDKKMNGGKDRMAMPISALQAMRTKKGSRIKATYPNDASLWWNDGWSAVNAPLVWPNTTGSAGVCELDTGVDYLHPDLSGKIVKGYDFVNDDADPMDDFGHGTHVAGIIAAKMNNAIGIAGVSTGNVVAVKVLGGQGWGTNYDVAIGIHYCAVRKDVRVLNLSLGGPYSQTMEREVDYATNTMRKVIVAAAGNDNVSSYCGYWNDNGTPGDLSDDFWVNQGDERSYPAGFSTEAHNFGEGVACATDLGTQKHPGYTGVLSVAASGQWTYDPYGDYWWVNYGCKATYSNYGDWVNVVGPGTSIYSTTPYDKPFYANYYYGWSQRYEWLDGTSMATPFVAASAARDWGYRPLDPYLTVADDTANYSNWQMYDDGTSGCWPSSMEGRSQVDVAALLDRGGFSAAIFDASNGNPLGGAQLQIYQGTTLRGTGIVPVDTPWTDVLNLPAGSGYVAKVSKTNYTATPQLAFQQSTGLGIDTVYSGWYNWAGSTAVPPKTSSFNTVLGWWWWSGWGEVNQPDYSDLDMYAWLPSYPNLLDGSQPGQFIVGFAGSTFDYPPLEGDSTGELFTFPFARWKRDGGYGDSLQLENTTISSRKAHGTLATNSALPYYPGDYAVMVTDYEQTMDHDANGGTPDIPLMGAYFQPFVYIWKDGVIKAFVIMSDPMDPNGPCNTHWWNPITIHSGVSGAVGYTTTPYACNDDGSALAPYWWP